MPLFKSYRMDLPDSSLNEVKNGRYFPKVQLKRTKVGLISR